MNLRLLDLVDFGLPESEAGHTPLGLIAERREHPRNAYQGPEFLGQRGPMVHLREHARWNAVEVHIPEQARSRRLVFEITLRAYPWHYPEDATAPTAAFCLMQRDRAWHLGTTPLPLDGRFRTFRLGPVAPELSDDPCFFVMDFLGGWISGERHAGQSLGSLAVYVDGAPEPSAPVRPAPRGEARRETDVVFVNCPVWDTSMPHVALGYLPSFLRHSGLSVAVEDVNIEAHAEAPATRRFLWDGPTAPMWSEEPFRNMALRHFEPWIQRAAERIARRRPSTLAFTVASTNAAVTRRLSEVLRERLPETRFIFGGAGIPFLRKEDLGDAWDYLVVGAGEYPLLHLARRRPGRIQGVIARGEDRKLHDPHWRARILDVNRMPPADFLGLDLSRYGTPWRLPVVTSRGCINQCKYCFDHVFYGPFSALTGENAYRQLVHLFELHGRRDFAFCDLLCNGDLEAWAEMCERLIAGGHNFRWGSFAVIRDGMTPELLRLARRAGCHYLHYGFESGSQRMLDLMGRNYTVDDAARVLRDTHEAGITTRINLIVGFPGETDQTIEETIAFIRRHAAVIDVVETVNPVYLMKLSTLFDEHERFGIQLPPGEAVDEWATPEMDQARREAWVLKVIEGVRATGVTSHLAISRSFQCRNFED